MTKSQRTNRPGRRSAFRRQAVAVVVLLAISGVAVAGWVAGTRIQSPAAAAAKAAPPEPSLITAPVEQRVLSTRVVNRGDVVPGASTTVSGPSATGATIVTGVFVQVGDELFEGDRIVEVSGRPVFVFEGRVPAFRTMRPGMQGLDVDQLQAGLGRLGCDTTNDDGLYGDITKRCVAALYEQLGYPTVATSDDEEDKLNAAAEAVSQAEAQLANDQKALDEAIEPPTALELATEQIALDSARRKAEADRRAAADTAIDNGVAIDGALIAINAELAKTDASPADRQKVSNDLAAAVRKADADTIAADEAVVVADEALLLAEAKFAELTTVDEAVAQRRAVEKAEADLERTQQALADLQARSGATVPLGELVFVDTLPATVSTLSARVGTTVGSGDGSGTGSGALAVLATAALQVNSYIGLADVEHLSLGMDVVLLDEVSGNELDATLTSLGEQIESSANGSARGFPAVIEADGEIPRQWTGRNVKVTFTGAQTAGEVLVVPVVALTAGADGGARVQVEDADGTVRTVAVTAGLSADGFVEVTPIDAGDLAAGDQVVVGREG